MCIKEAWDALRFSVSPSWWMNNPFLPVPADPDHCGLCLQVRTLFVSGLPVDIKPRELYLLFRPFKVSQDPGAPRAQDQG